MTTRVGPTEDRTVAERPTSLGGFTWVDGLMLCVVLIWGLNFVVLKLALPEFELLAFVAVRFAVATVSLLLLTWWREGNVGCARADFWRLLGLGLLGNGLYQILFMNGIARTSAGNTSLMLATSPIFVALMSAFLGERIPRLAWWGIGLSFVGIGLIIEGGAGAQLGSEHLLGDLFVLGAAVCWGCYTPLLRPFLKRYSPLKLNMLTMALGTLPLFVLGAPAVTRQPWGQVSAGAWLGLLYTALFGIVAAYLIWNIGVQRAGSARTAVYSNLVPVCALVAAALLLGERIYPLQLVGAAIVIAGIVLTRRR